MPSKRQILDQLKRDELIAAVERCELPVADRRVRDLLIAALASSRKATLAEILGDLKRARLKELCRTLGLDDGGREQAVIIERLTGQAPAAAAQATLRTKGTKTVASSAGGAARPVCYTGQGRVQDFRQALDRPSRTPLEKDRVSKPPCFQPTPKPRGVTSLQLSERAAPVAAIASVGQIQNSR